MTTSTPAAAQPLEPPAAAAGDLTLAEPKPVAAVDTAAATGMVPLDKAALPGLDKMVGSYVSGLADLDPKSPEFGAKAESIRTMGDEDIRAAAEVSNRLLQSPVRAMSKGGFTEGSKVSTSLVELRQQIEDLDPKNATGVRKLLGVIPFGDKIRAYFAKYQSAQKHINAILNALYEGQDELRKDNAALEQEKEHLWDTMQRLVQYIYVAEQLDTSLTSTISKVESSDPDRAKRLQEDVLFYVRQKHQDLLTQLAVSIQAYLAIDLVRKNNGELIKGVDRATTTTISALRTAVIVAQALANQKLVLDQITALNATTSNMIETTSELLKDQSAEVQEQAASATIDIQKLQKAFDNIYAALDEIDTYKVAALGSMQKTIDALSAEIEASQQHLDRMQDEAQGRTEAPAAGSAARGELTL